MIYLYSGTPGSGKSLHAARDVMNTLADDRPVIANFKVNPDVVRHYERFEYVPNESLAPSLLVEFSRGYFGGARVKEDQILLVVDEAQLLFNSRTWSLSDRSGWIVFFSQHRHYGYRVVLIAQSDRMLDRQIRCLIEYEVSHRKVSSFGKGGKLLSLLTGDFMEVTMYYGLKEKLKDQTRRSNRRLYKVYDSYGTFEGQAGLTSGKGIEDPS